MEVVQQKSWFRRNWLWFVPSMGCLTLIILLAIGVFGIFSMINDSEPTQYGIQKASEHPKVIELLGEPIEKNGLPSGEMSYSTDTGSTVDFIIPIKGPKNKASLIVKGYKEDGKWIYEKLHVLIGENREKINLLEKVLEGL